MTATGTTNTVVTVDPTTDPRWAVLAARRTTPLFLAPPWISAVADTYGFAPTARVTLDADGAPSSGLAWTPVADVRGRRLVSLPFGDRADPPVRDAAELRALLACLPADHGPFTVRCLDTDPLATDGGLDVVGVAAWHATATDVPVETMFARINPGARRDVRTAQRHGVRIEVDPSLAAIRRFYRLHAALRKHKYRLLPQPLALFERIWAEFAARDAIFTVGAHVGDDMVAGAVCITWNDVLYYKFSASDPRHLTRRPNEVVVWNALRRAAELGLRAMDWGRSDLDQPGLVAFKRKWATEERRLLTLRRPGPPPDPHADALLGELTALLTEETVPDAITARAGALLYRHFC